MFIKIQIVLMIIQATAVAPVVKVTKKKVEQNTDKINQKKKNDDLTSLLTIHLLQW